MKNTSNKIYQYVVTIGIIIFMVLKQSTRSHLPAIAPRHGIKRIDCDSGCMLCPLFLFGGVFSSLRRICRSMRRFATPKSG